MIRKFKLLTILLAISSLTVFAAKSDFSKEIHQAFLKSDIESLQLVNKYGTITINDMGGDSVTIDVTIVVENAYENKAEYLLDQIEIEIRKSGSTILAETDIKPDFKTKQDFSIDYLVNIPADKNLTISNKYGNVVLNTLEANGKFEIGYGNITAETLKAPDGKDIMLSLAYSKADIQDVNNLNAEIKYSKLYLGQTIHMMLESKYSTININEVNELTTDSKYDGFSIDIISSLKADSKYTHYSIDELHKKLILQTEYGNVSIDDIGKDFEIIDITNSYGGIKLGLDNNSYKLLAECSYCGVIYPENRFTGNREKDNHELKINGTIGDGKGNVRIISRYGGIKLKD